MCMTVMDGDVTVTFIIQSIFWLGRRKLGIHTVLRKWEVGPDLTAGKKVF